MYIKIIKPAIDVILSFLAIIALALPMAAIVIAVKLDDPGPAIFRQKRVGKNGRLFTLYKFRSMKMDTPTLPTHLLKDPEKFITRVGGFLRKTSLDELPQIYNIFTLRMSIIGPRPALPSQTDLLAEREKYGANAFRPGLTGWAQINGRDELEISEKARLDGEYAAKAGFLFDVKCFFGTIKSVLRRDGVKEGGPDSGSRGSGAADRSAATAEDRSEKADE